LKIAFKIPPTVEDVSALHLLVEAGNDEISFLLFSQNPFAVEGLYLCQLEKNITATDYANSIEKIIAGENILQQSFASVQIFYNFATATLMPAQYFVEAEKENVLELMFGKDKAAYTFYETVKDNDTKLVYRIAAKIYETMNAVFPKNRFSHATSSQLQTPINTGDTLTCIVYHSCIKLFLFKEKALQIVQFFDYEIPLDVSYHLLNVCERFGVSASLVNLSVGGMIDEKSNLYDEIYKYFLNVSFTSLPANTIVAENMNALPTHFYSNLTALAACV
jgi:hypothetical protein